MSKKPRCDRSEILLSAAWAHPIARAERIEAAAFDPGDLATVCNSSKPVRFSVELALMKLGVAIAERAARQAAGSSSAAVVIAGSKR